MGYARKDVEKTKKIAKKFVRYQEGAELYSITYEECVQMVGQMKDSFETDVFGVEKDVMVKLIMNVLISA